MKKLFAAFVLIIAYQGYSQTNYVSNVIVSTLAGNYPYADGQGKSARFNNPLGVAVDVFGNVYVADWGNAEIRKITASGLVSTFAGSHTYGTANGQAANASFSSTSGVAVDTSGNVYVADKFNNQIRKITPSGFVSTLAGSTTSGHSDGQGASASFNYPTDVAVDVSGNVYVADYLNNEIRKITPDGLVTTLAGSTKEGSINDQGIAASFYHPMGIAVDISGNVYVADLGNNTIRKITPGGLVSTLAGSFVQGNNDGQGSAATFNGPTGVAVDINGNIYVADNGNNTIRKISSTGLVTTLAGSPTSGSVDGQGTAASFNQPNGVAVDASGNVYVADASNNIIRKITSDGLVSTLAGDVYGVDGQGTEASFKYPLGLAVDTSGNIYVADFQDSEIRKITPDGLVSTVAGSIIPGNTDGQGTVASFNVPTSVAVDDSGNIYVVDTGNNEIRKITPDGLVSTLAGSSTSGNTNGQGASARFNHPMSIAVDKSGNLYVADEGNNEIRKITPDGLVSTLAGSGAYGSIDGLGAAASFYEPMGVAVDDSGNVYVADYVNHKIRKITPVGLVSTLAGSGAGGNSDGQGAEASFAAPTAVCVDTFGNVYVADGLSAIRKITPDGLVSTLAGSPILQGSTNGQGFNATFCGPQGITVDASGNVYVADAGNNQIRKITIGLSATTPNKAKDTNVSCISVYPNPAKDILNIALSEAVNGTLSILDIQGSLVLTQPVNGKQVQLSTVSLQNGIYVLNVVSDNASYVTRVVIAK